VGVPPESSGVGERLGVGVGVVVVGTGGGYWAWAALPLSDEPEMASAAGVQVSTTVPRMMAIRAAVFIAPTANLPS
jgi:hypothetical protein